MELAHHTPPNKKPQKKILNRQTILVVVFAIFVVLGGGYYYMLNFGPTETESLVDLQAKRQLPVKKVNWQKVLYEHSGLKSLRNPLSGPLEIGSLGNDHPFQAPAVSEPINP